MGKARDYQFAPVSENTRIFNEWNFETPHTIAEVMDRGFFDTVTLLSRLDLIKVWSNVNAEPRFDLIAVMSVRPIVVKHMMEYGIVGDRKEPAPAMNQETGLMAKHKGAGQYVVVDQGGEEQTGLLPRDEAVSIAEGRRQLPKPVDETTE